jgi:paraquat-inducible protein B
MAQLPAVQAVLSGPQWQAFQQQVLQQHEAMEKQRTQPWAQMVPGLASTLQHLDSSVATLSATVQRTSLQQQEQPQERQQGAVAADSGATPVLSPSKRSTAPAIPKLYSDKVATVQEACQEYW